jgi:hypothetical protein
MRSALALALALSVGCGAPHARTGDDAWSDGADAFTAGVDASVPAMDAFTPGDDAASVPADAFSSVDATWGPCSYLGTPGVCESTSLCTGGSMPMMGLCPGPADIQCCLPPRPDSGTRTITADDVRAALGACARIGGDYATDVGGTANIPICRTSDVIWWSADMDIDCDGGLGSVCMSDPDYMASTSGVDSHGNPLDASTLPFIVIPLASTRFRYADYGIRTGQVAVVLYGDQIAFGIFGDAGPSSIIGEASYAMAGALGIPNDPSTGGVDSGVTYLVFTDATARVAHAESHAEAVDLGSSLLDALVP